MNKLDQIAYNCRKATLLIEKQQVAVLTMAEQVELKIHLAGCSACRLFQQQSVNINKMIKQLFKEKSARSTLSTEFKKSLQDKIDRGSK